MERAEWLKTMRSKAETLYDRISPQYWVTFGLEPNETHFKFLRKLLERIPKSGTVLSAGCGAGRYDGLLLEAGHSVVGIDQSAGMLERARQRFPAVRYEKMGLQDMDFGDAFVGAICIEALEHVAPEDWPGILSGFKKALKPAGVLYFTVDLAEKEELEAHYQRARDRGLPVEFGELVDEVDTALEQIGTSGHQVPANLADRAVYHYYPALEQVRAWVAQAGFSIEEEGTGDGYQHFIVRNSRR